MCDGSSFSTTQNHLSCANSLKTTQIFVIFSELQEDKSKERTKDKVVSEDEDSLSTSSSDEEFNDGFDENLFAGEEDRKTYGQ